MKANVKTYIGFCIKKRSVVYGLEQLETYRKKIFLILLCGTAQPNTVKKVQELAAVRQIPLLITPTPLSELAAKTNVKVIGLTDQSLSAAIQKNFVAETEEKP